MLARLGDVLYWVGCLLAVLLVAAATVLVLNLFELLILTGLAVIIWMISRACRYVLAGR
jgi:hypothetical protein